MLNFIQYSDKGWQYIYKYLQNVKNLQNLLAYY